MSIFAGLRSFIETIWQQSKPEPTVTRCDCDGWCDCHNFVTRCDQCPVTVGGPTYTIED